MKRDSGGTGRGRNGAAGRRPPVPFPAPAAGRFASPLALAGVLMILQPVARADTPVTPDASPEAQSLLAFLEHTYGRNIISGQQTGEFGPDALPPELKHIRDASSKLPALLALDLSACTRPDRRRHDVADRAADWYLQRNGLVSLCWHWTAPMHGPSAYAKETRFDAARAVTDGTPEHAALLRDIDRLAGELGRLRARRVPVLWRPLHEANGRWFWWGAAGPEPFKKLWRILFERLTVQHRLNNLLWVFSPGAAIDLGDWYPGDAYVDLIAPDHYPLDGNHGPATDIFTEMVALGGGTKPVGFGENGALPAPDLLVRENARWLFFISWSGRTLTDRNSKEQIRETYHHAHVLKLGNLPDLKTYPAPPAGPPVQLAFVGRLDDMAVDSPGWRPVVVAVQDAAGRTVRAGKQDVTVKLEENSSAAALSGTLTVQTVNGLAVFPDLQINRAGARFTLRAESPPLLPATSAGFRVGPGSGLDFESWTDRAGSSATDATPADWRLAETVRLGKAFERPVKPVRHFHARGRGYLLPPLTGNYVFGIATDSDFQLWLSPDESPEKLVKIAEATGATPYAKWPHTHEVRSAAVWLEAGRRYYLEARQRQNDGSAHFAVHWVMPNGVGERPIRGARFAGCERGETRPPAGATP
jgi:hypothetical protein